MYPASHPVPAGIGSYASISLPKSASANEIHARTQIIFASGFTAEKTIARRIQGSAIAIPEHTTTIIALLLAKLSPACSGVFFLFGSKWADPVTTDATCDVIAFSESKHSPNQITMAELVNLFTITSFLVRQHVGYKKELNCFNCNRVISAAVLPGSIIKGSFQASMKKIIYEVEVS